MRKSKPFIIDSLALFELIIYPSFEQLAPDYNGVYNGTLSEFNVMDKVSLAHGTPLMEIFKNMNFLKRKEASCSTEWSQVARTDARKITITELYGAVENCQEEFYQGSLKDFRNQNKRFRDMILQFFKEGMAVDLTVNSYFGDVTRADDSNPVVGQRWNWNKFDGIFTKIAGYISDGKIPGAQVLNALPDAETTPQEAYDILKDAYDKQPVLMDNLPDASKAFYVNKSLAKAYFRYMQSIGQTTETNMMLVMNGMPALSFEGIPIYIEPLFDPALFALNNNTRAHACILTVRNNWIYGTDKDYGGGPDLKQGLRVWWSDDDEVWKQKMYLTAGTEITAPEYTVFGMTDIA